MTIEDCTGLNFDVAIIGGGIVGLSLAWQFAKVSPKLKVALISPNKIEGSASYASGAMISRFGETTTLSFASKAARTKIEWRIKASELWKDWSEELAATSGNESCKLNFGTMVVVNAVSGYLDERNLDTMLHLLRNRNEPFSEVDPYKDFGLRPSTPDRPMRSIYIPKEGYVTSSAIFKLPPKGPYELSVDQSI
jgi:L-2-hydroxyglutarate oxidase LhgO